MRTDKKCLCLRHPAKILRSSFFSSIRFSSDMYLLPDWSSQVSGAMSNYVVPLALLFWSMSTDIHETLSSSGFVAARIGGLVSLIRFTHSTVFFMLDVAHFISIPFFLHISASYISEMVNRMVFFYNPIDISNPFLAHFEFHDPDLSNQAWYYLSK